MKLPLETDGVRDPDWDAYYRFVEEDGHATVAEVRIVLRTRTRAAERDLHKTLRRDGGDQRVPVSPLTAKALRSVSPTAAHHYLRVWAGRSQSAPDTFTRFAEGRLASEWRPRKKRVAGRVLAMGIPPDPDVHLAAFAKLYVDVIRRGSRSPIADIAGANPGWKRTYVRDQVYLAREKGFLTPERHGLISGDLTLKARRVLRRADGSL